VSSSAVFAEPSKEAQTIIKLDQFIQGRQVMRGSVNISLNVRTLEVVTIDATFLPDRDLDHEPRSTAALAKAKAIPGMQQSLNERLGSADRKFRFVDGPDPKLVYEIEQPGSAPFRGVLVWNLSVIDQASNQRYQVHVDAATGRIVRAWPYVN
jgi:peptidase YpeB-like protein